MKAYLKPSSYGKQAQEVLRSFLNMQHPADNASGDAYHPNFGNIEVKVSFRPKAEWCFRQLRRGHKLDQNAQ